MQKKKSLYRAKLAKVMSEPQTKAKDKFHPTESDCKEWFGILNTLIFNDKLKPFDEFRIGRRRGVWARCQGCYHLDYGKEHVPTRSCYLEINNWLQSKQHFIKIMGHEMIHHHEWTIDGVDEHYADHGATFQKWIPKMKKYKIDI